MKNINCYRGAMWPDPVFLFSYSIFDVLFFANRFMFTFHLFFSRLLFGSFYFIFSSSFVRSFGSCLEFSHFQTVFHINSGDKDEVNRDRFAFCTWALILFVCDVCVIRKFPFSWDYSHFLSLFVYVFVCVLVRSNAQQRMCMCVCVWRWNTQKCGYVYCHYGAHGYFA